MPPIFIYSLFAGYVHHASVTQPHFERRPQSQNAGRDRAAYDDPFYKYFTIANPQHTRDALYQMFTALNVFGRVYLAHEGINAQISVPQSNVEAFRQQLYAFDPALNDLRLNIALDDDGKSFWVLRMKVRERIVADGIDDPDFDASNVGIISRQQR